MNRISKTTTAKIVHMTRSSTQKIVVIAIITSLLVLILNLLPLANVMRYYLYSLVLAVAIGASVVLMGWAKPRGQSCRLVFTFVILAAVVFQVITFLLLGLKLGFVHNVYGWNSASILRIFLPVTLAIIGEEALRGQLIEKGRGSLLAVIITGLAICFITVLTTLPAYDLAEPGVIFTVLVTIVGPTFLDNILLTYIAYAYNYRINFAYRLIMDLPVYLLPILPNAGLFLPILFHILLVIILILSLAGVYKINRRKLAVPSVVPKRPATATQKQLKHIIKWVGLGVVILAVVSYVALMSGLFKYYFLAIGSGSMEPNLYRGDMVLVEKSKAYDEMAVGEVLVYQYSNAVMVHRISQVNEVDGKYIFRTKGDNNPGEDAWQVEQDDVIGLAKGKIAKFGFPTLWLNELFNQ